MTIIYNDDKTEYKRVGKGKVTCWIPLKEWLIWEEADKDFQEKIKESAKHKK